MCCELLLGRELSVEKHWIIQCLIPYVVKLYSQGRPRTMSAVKGGGCKGICDVIWQWARGGNKKVPLDWRTRIVGILTQRSVSLVFYKIYVLCLFYNNNNNNSNNSNNNLEYRMLNWKFTGESNYAKSRFKSTFLYFLISLAPYFTAKADQSMGGSLPKLFLFFFWLRFL